MAGLSKASLPSPACNSLCSVLIDFLAVSRAAGTLLPWDLCIFCSICKGISCLRARVCNRGVTWSPRGCLGLSGDGFDEHTWGILLSSNGWRSQMLLTPYCLHNSFDNGEFPHLECPGCWGWESPPCMPSWLDAQLAWHLCWNECHSPSEVFPNNPLEMALLQDTPSTQPFVSP